MMFARTGTAAVVVVVAMMTVLSQFSVTAAFSARLSSRTLSGSGFGIVRQNRHPLTTLRQQRISEEEAALDEKLLGIAKKLKLEIFDLDEGIYGFDSQDPRYGLEVIKTTLRFGDGEGLGLVLTEVAGNADGRGLVLVSDVSGNAARAAPSEIMIGDVITGVIAPDTDVRERTTGLNYDFTVEAIGNVKAAAAAAGGGAGAITLELNRLVERSRVQVEVDDGSGDIMAVEALAGENLRRLLMRKGVKLYDDKTKRFDMPFATGDCAGEGLCGTCLVSVEEGQDCLNPMDNLEQMLTKGRPLSWRASCRAVVGYDNKPGKMRIVVKPQSKFEDELDPGVRDLS